MEYVHVKARASFNGYRIGQDYVNELDRYVRGYISAGLLEVIEGGTGEAGPEPVEPDPAGGEPTEGGDSGEADAEQGEGARPRRHRASARKREDQP